MAVMDRDPGIEQPTVEPAGVTPFYFEASQSSTRGPSHRRTIAAVAAVALLVLGVSVVFASAGSDNGKPVSNAELLRMVHSASGAMERTPATTFKMTETVSAQGHHLTIQMSGVTRTRDHASTMTVTGPGLSEGGIGVGGYAYVQVPTASVKLNHGKAWVGVRSPKPTPEQQQLSDAGPAGLLSALKTVNGTVRDVGTNEIGGVQTTEYSFHANLLGLFGSTLAKILGQSSTSELKALGFDSLPMKLWLDRQGLPREMSLAFTVQGVSLNEVALMTPTTAVPVISAPPASDVRMVRSLRQFGSVLRNLGAAAR